MFRKVFSTLVLGAVAAAAYYAYKNRGKIDGKLEEEKVIHFISEDEADASSETKKKAKMETEKNK